MTKNMDLLYIRSKDYQEVWDGLRLAFPEAVLENGSDEIHEGRISIVYPRTQNLAYFRWLVKNRWVGASLTLGLVAKIPNESSEETVNDLYTVLNEVRAEKGESPLVRPESRRKPAEASRDEKWPQEPSIPQNLVELGYRPLKGPSLRSRT